MTTATAQGPIQALNLIDACLGDLTRALSDRPWIPDDQRPAHTAAARHLVMSFKPQDTTQLLVSGQMVLFSALTADAAHDILRGIADPLKPRACSTAIAMGRIVAKHLHTLLRLQGRVGRPAKKVPASEEIPISAVQPESPAQIGTQTAPPADDKRETPLAEASPTPAAEPTSPTSPGTRIYPGRDKMLRARLPHVSGRKQKHLTRNARPPPRAARGQ